MTRDTEPLAIEAQIAVRVDEIRRAQEDDPPAAIALAAYFARRSLLFSSELRDAAVARLRPWLHAATDEDRIQHPVLDFPERTTRHR